MNNFPTIKKEEFTKRIQKIREKMSENDIDILVGFSNLLDPSAVRYFTDFAAVNESAAIIIPASGMVTLCSGQASYDYALIKNKLGNSVIKVFPEIGEVSGFEYDFEGQLDFYEYFKEIKNNHNVKKIGLMGKLIFPSIIYNKLENVFDGAEIVNFDAELYEIRSIKSNDEIACMKKSSQIISEVFDYAVPMIKEGMTELEIQALFEGRMLELGAESYVQAFAPMVATGKVNSHISMCRNTLRKVEKGEIINLAAGSCYEGYNGVICSPFVIGEIPEKIKDAVRCAYEALNLAASKMKPGAGTREILDVYTDFLTQKGYIDYCPYGSLHSTGMLECEAPVFSVDNNREIKENMTICIDAYFKGMEWGSFRIEDTYVITKDGAERMTFYNDKVLPQILSK